MLERATLRDPNVCTHGWASTLPYEHVVLLRKKNLFIYDPFVGSNAMDERWLCVARAIPCAQEENTFILVKGELSFLSSMRRVKGMIFQEPQRQDERFTP